MSSITDIGKSVRFMWNYRHEPECLRALADTYWHGLLAVGGITVLAFMMYGGIKFITAVGPGVGDLTLSSPEARIPLNSTELRSLVDSFSALERRYEFERKNRPRTADPSR